jgi:hypothetical protein
MFRYECNRCNALLKNLGAALCETCRPHVCWFCHGEFTAEKVESPFLKGVHRFCEGMIEIDIPL